MDCCEHTSKYIGDGNEKKTDDKKYICPMHPEVVSDKQGNCPECGMNLVPTGDTATSDKGHSTRIFLKKFWVSLILTMPILAYSELPKAVFDFEFPDFVGKEYLSLILGSMIFFYGGWVFIIGAWREIRGKMPGMMTLIGIAISAAYIFSVWSVLAGKEHNLFWELSTLIVVMLLGHYIEMKAVQSTQGALKELSKLLPDKAEIVISDMRHSDTATQRPPQSGTQQETRMVTIAELKVGDVVFVRPGARVPIDGEVMEGKSEVDESMVTGESKPVLKNIGGEVIAGTINIDGSLKIKVTKIGEHTFLAGVMKLVAEAQASKSKLQILSDRAAFYLTNIAIAGGLITFFVWFLSDKGFDFAVERLVAVLVIACPHALGLAVPLVASISTTVAARAGFLVKQRLALESARNIDVVLFDKTGTLTKGEYGITAIISNPKFLVSDERILQFAASVDAHSEHFIAKAIVKTTKEKNIPFLEVKDFKRLPGKGVFGIVEGKEIFVGGESILTQTNADLTQTDAENNKDWQQKIKKLAEEGQTIIYVIQNSELSGAIALADIIREESKEAVAALKLLGVKTAIMTGDSEEVAKWVAAEIGIDEYFAKVLPQEKAEKVKLLQSKGLKVAMIGDGINDAPALTQADLGVAIGAGTNVAIESAGIILMRNDPRDIVKIIKLSKLTYRKMAQNIFWATGYNIVAMPLAAGVLVSYGIMLQPAIAAILMSLSSIIVSFNALLLRKEAKLISNG